MEEKIKNNQVHSILAHSYSFYFLSFLLGIILDFIFPLRLLVVSFAPYLGLIFIISGPLIILWAQRTSLNSKKDATLTSRNFCKGPYCFTRSPTHLGIALLILGFGILVNAFFVVVLTLIAFIVTKFTFLRQEESILEKKYGAPYIEYKKIVKL